MVVSPVSSTEPALFNVTDIKLNDCADHNEHLANKLNNRGVKDHAFTIQRDNMSNGKDNYALDFDCIEKAIDNKLNSSADIKAEPDIVKKVAGDRTIDQRSYVSIGRKSATGNVKEYGQRLRNKDIVAPIHIKPENAESLWPVGVFIPPIDINDLGYSSQESRHTTPDFSNGLEYHDPYLLIGEEAMLAVKYLYDQGELFYDDIPHERALLKNQEERRRNGLHDHILRSLRLTSSFSRKS